MFNCWQHLTTIYTYICWLDFRIKRTEGQEFLRRWRAAAHFSPGKMRWWHMITFLSRPKHIVNVHINLNSILYIYTLIILPLLLLLLLLLLYIYDIYIYKYLDLHLALFSDHSSFRLDFRSFWLFMLTWTRKRAFVSWRTGIYVFFPGIYAYFPGKYAHMEKNHSKSRNLANEHLFVFFRGYRYTIIYLQPPKQFFLGVARKKCVFF